MSRHSSSSKKAFFQAVFVFGLLFSIVVLLTIFYDFSDVDLEGLLFLLALLCCLFVAKNTYDLTKALEHSEQIKKTAARDLAFSSEELYVQLYKNSPIPYMLLDQDGKVQSANTAAVRMLGVRQSEVKGLAIFEKILSDKVGHLDFLIEKHRSGLSISDEMVRVRRAKGGQAWALLSLFSFTDTAEQKIGLLTLVDITKQKKAEDAKSEFVSLASHQLRTPIAGMKWSTELLQLDSPETLTQRQHKYIDRLLISIDRMAVLVDDFLRVSRFELGTFQAEYSSTSLSTICADVLTEQTAKAEQKNLQIKTFFDPETDQILTDPNLIRMIVTNLYSNAIKYSTEGGTVHIGFGQKGNSVILSVADNGMGIPAEDQASIFSKLFRASNAVRNVPDGTGLGLYIVHQAVSVLKGSVSFTTTEGVGTTFEVVLPLERPKADVTQ